MVRIISKYKKNDKLPDKTLMADSSQLILDDLSKPNADRSHILKGGISLNDISQVTLKKRRLTNFEL